MRVSFSFRFFFLSCFPCSPRLCTLVPGALLNFVLHLLMVAPTLRPSFTLSSLALVSTLSLSRSVRSCPHLACALLALRLSCVFVPLVLRLCSAGSFLCSVSIRGLICSSLDPAFALHALSCFETLLQIIVANRRSRWTSNCAF